jgi:tRNA threonylcarbamoyladenosine biosynthesis protein TsaB
MLLAVDTATKRIGIALYDGVEVLHEAVWQSPFRHTVELTPAIEQALKSANLTIKNIKAVALTIGPGSYTGLRIGAAAAKGLAMARSIPLIAISTFDVMAFSLPTIEDHQLAVVLQAGRGRISVGWYEILDNVWQTAREPELLTAQDFSKKIRTPTYVCGELDEETRSILGRKRKNVKIASPAHSLRRPSFLAEMAWQRWQAGDVDNPQTLAPIYLQTTENIPS